MTRPVLTWTGLFVCVLLAARRRRLVGREAVEQCRAGAWCMISMQAEPSSVRKTARRASEEKRKRNIPPTQDPVRHGRDESVGRES